MVTILYKFNKMVQIVTSADFQTKVLSGKGLIMVDFYADWCGPCKAMNPILEELSESMKDKVEIVKINVDESVDTAQEYGVMSIPTFLFFKDGEQVGEQRGSIPKDSLVEKINSLVS